MNGYIIDQIRSGQEQVLFDLYRTHRGAFVEWATFSYTVTADDAKDIFQDAFVNFWPLAIGPQAQQPGLT